MLTEEFRTQGEWLFRWRSYLPLILVALIGVGFQQANLQSSEHEPWEYVCLGISFLGLFVRVMTIGRAPRHTSGRNVSHQIAAELNTTGMYSIVRHPLYLGNYLIGLGITFVLLVWWLPVIYSLMFWLYYERIMFAEEAFLRQKFGDAYQRWAESTPAFWPRITQWHKPSLPFSWRTILRREYSGLMVVILCHAAQEFTELLIKDHRVVWEAFWATLLFGGLAMYFILRWLNRSTTVLDVPGR